MKKLLCPCVFAIVLQGCAATGVPHGPTDAELSRLSAGTTTADEVKALLGPPVRTSRNERLGRDIWEYRRHNDLREERLIAIQFSADGIMREVLSIKELVNEPGSP
jgi:hypothetical protein